MEEKIKEYCEKLGVSLNDLMKKNGGYKLTDIKHLIWYTLRKEGYKVSDIAKKFNMSTHSSVVYGISRIEDLLDSNDKIISQKNKSLTCQ